MIKFDKTAELAMHYPDRSATLSINVNSALLKRSKIAELANTLASHLVEFNPGNLPISISPDAIPEPKYTAAETIEKIGEANSWMTLRNIEHDPDYKDLTDKIIDQAAPFITPKTGNILQREAFFFISSPGAITPFHFDEEHNILIQIEGTKTVHLFSQHDRDLASQEDLERFHAGAHRNLALDPDHADRATPIAMTPGDALYIPPLAPHWVKVTGDSPSLSLSVTWRSNSSRRVCYLHQINHELRAKGLKPQFPGKAPLADQFKIWRASAQRRLGRSSGV